MAEEPREHWLAPDDSYRLCLLELAPTVPANGRAIVCFHGIFADSRTFWSAHDPQRAATWFTARGYRVFLADFRGHGRSPAPPGRWRWSFDEVVRADVPAFLAFVAARHAGPTFVLAHSFGGCSVHAALALRPALQAGLAGVASIASALNDYTDGPWRKRWQFPLAGAVSAMLGRMPARRLGMGSADEPGPLMRQFVRWSLQGSFRSADGSTDYWPLLRAVRLPIWTCAATADTYYSTPARVRKFFDHLGSEDRSFRIFGREQGDPCDFDHFGLVMGADAMRIVLPVIAAWFDARAGQLLPGALR